MARQSRNIRGTTLNRRSGRRGGRFSVYNTHTMTMKSVITGLVGVAIGCLMCSFGMSSTGNPVVASMASVLLHVLFFIVGAVLAFASFIYIFIGESDPGMGTGDSARAIIDTQNFYNIQQIRNNTDHMPK